MTAGTKTHTETNIDVLDKSCGGVPAARGMHFAADLGCCIGSFSAPAGLHQPPVRLNFASLSFLCSNRWVFVPRWPSKCWHG